MEKKQAFTEMMAIYYEWFKEKRSFTPRIDGSDGKALKQIVDYLFTLNEDKQGAVDTFRYILDNWDRLSEFYQKGVRLRQINGNLVNIIDFFKNAKNRTGVSQDYLQRMVSDLS